MKIEKIETEIVDVKFFPDRSRQQLLVRITTDEGLTGIGEAWSGGPPGPVKAAVTDLLAPLIMGEDSGRIEDIWYKMYRRAYLYGAQGVVVCAISGIDLALWDLLGKRLNVPAAEILGGRVKESVRVYASFPALRSEGLLKKNLEKIMDFGFTGVKLHDLDEKMVALTREIVGEDFTITIDPHGHWSVAETREMARRLERYNLLWIEEPVFPMQDHGLLLRAGRNSPIGMASGENEYTLDGYYRLMQCGALDFIQPEIGKTGGLTMARKIAVMAEVFNLTVSPHCYIVGPAFYAGIQLGLTQRHMDWHEMKWLPAGYEHLHVPPPELIDGCVVLSDRPGLGLPID